jgi:hypothetical protein
VHHLYYADRRGREEGGGGERSMDWEQEGVEKGEIGPFRRTLFIILFAETCDSFASLSNSQITFSHHRSKIHVCNTVNAPLVSHRQIVARSSRGMSPITAALYSVHGQDGDHAIL